MMRARMAGIFVWYAPPWNGPYTLRAFPAGLPDLRKATRPRGGSRAGGAKGKLACWHSAEGGRQTGARMSTPHDCKGEGFFRASRANLLAASSRLVYLRFHSFSPE